jgi:hypothetical protein
MKTHPSIITVSPARHFAAVVVGVIALGFVLPVYAAADYYVATTGSDTGGSGSIGSPWKTVKYSVAHLSPGDTLYVRGGTYRESYIDTFPSGTSENARITVKAYNNEKPVISSMSDASGIANWTLVSGNVYSYNGAVATNYRNVSVSGKPLQLMTGYSNFNGSSSDISGEGQWSRSQNEAKLWVCAPGGGNPGALNVEISYAYHTVYLQKTLQYITLEGIAIEGGYYPIDIEADHVVVRNCTFRNCFGDAIKGSGWTQGMSPPEWNSEYCVIDNCDIYYFGESGIDITGGDYWQVNSTLIHHGIPNRCPSEPEGANKLNGIMLKNNNIGTVVNGCRIFHFDTVFGAISLGGSAGATHEGVRLVARNNIIHDLGGPYIISFTGAEDCKFINNVIFNCDTTSSGVPGAPEALIQMRCADPAANNLLRSSGVVILNNIFYDNASTYNYRETVDGNDDGAEINNNFIGEARSSYFDGASIAHSDMTTLKGYDSGSFVGTPPFVNYSWGLVRLTTNSDASEAGVCDVAAPDDFNRQQRVNGSTVSIGAYERLAATTYCDGGSVANWIVPPGATISSVYDGGIGSDVIQTTDTTSMLFADSNYGFWNNSGEFIMTFKAKFSTPHSFQVRFKSSDGTMKIIKFYSNYTSAGPHTSSVYRFPLGTGSSSTEDGNWHAYIFNLADLASQVNPAESIDYIERFYVNGAGCVDDVELHNNLATAEMPKGLVGEWRLNEGVDSYTEDTSGFDRHGALINLSLTDPQAGSWVSGSEQKALKFDKSAQKYVSIPAITEAFTTGFTIDATVRFDNLDSSYDVIASGFQGNGAYGRLLEQNGLVYLQIRVTGDVLLYAVTQSNKIEAGKWQRITAKCDTFNGRIRIFVDGMDVTDTSRYNYNFTPAALTTGTGIMYLGSSPTSGHSFEGEIDNVRLFRRPLTDAEVAALANL